MQSNAIVTSHMPNTKAGAKVFFLSVRLTQHQILRFLSQSIYDSNHLLASKKIKNRYLS